MRDFVGREAELTALRALAREIADGGPQRGRGTPPSQAAEVGTARTPFPTAPPAAVVSGSPGSGKTTLAVRLAEELRASGCPDGAFLVDMRGLAERPLPAGQVVSGLLGSWGVGDAELVRLTAEERLARLPADIRDEAGTGLAALTAGRPAPATRFTQ